jgi:hypothetical protein
MKKIGMTWKDPREDVGPGRDLEQVLPDERPVLVLEDRHEPVADDHDEDRGDAEEVGVAVPRLGCGGGEVARTPAARARRSRLDHHGKCALPLR